MKNNISWKNYAVLVNGMIKVGDIAKHE